MSNTVIQVENLSKQYRLGQIGTGTIRDDLSRFWSRMRGKEDPTLKIGQTNTLISASSSVVEKRNTDKHHSDYVWALKDINFSVAQGEVLGIIGKNGAGKSTLLKILSKVTAPTTGNIKVKGRIASLLEVGTGFHPELTGRDNIFLNGAIIGMTKAEIRSKFDEIVDFSGVENYIDTPVKRYSSGMYVRLAFAVAAHLESEILILDEVLSVGDAEFQKKCLGKMGEVSRFGRTILFVSHNMGAVKALCSRAILLKNGTTYAEGSVDKITSLYLQGDNAMNGVFEIGKLSADEVVIINKAIFKNQNDKVTNEFLIGDDLVIEIHYTAKGKIPSPYFWIGVESQFGSLFGANALIDGFKPAFIEGEGKVTCVFYNLSLLPQTYSIWAGIRDSGGMGNLTTPKEIGFFNIVNKVSDLGLNGILAEVLATNSSPISVPYKWIFNNGETHEFNLMNYVK
jgi:lipopolysaccharide transport system ATP-binding protein